MWTRRSALIAARAALVCRSARSSSAAIATSTAHSQRAAHVPLLRAFPAAIGRVQCMSTGNTPTTEDDDGQSRPSIWDLAEQLRDPKISTKDREPVVAAIQAVAITGKSSDQKERQAREIIDSNVLPSMLNLLADERLIDFHVPTYLALIKLTAESLISQEILRLNGAGVIAPYLTNPDPRLQAAACVTLGNLALEPASVASMASVDVLDPLFHVLESPYEAIQRAAVTTIGTIAGTTKGRQQITSQIDHITSLCELLASDYSDSLRSAVAFALGNILSDHDAASQDALRESGALPELILMVSPAYADDVCSSAAWAIHHGVHLNYESQSMVVEAGGLPLLFQHVFADSETLQTNALLALESIVMGHEENLQSLRNNKEAVNLLEVLHENADDEELTHSGKKALNALLEQIQRQ